MDKVYKNRFCNWAVAQKHLPLLLVGELVTEGLIPQDHGLVARSVNEFYKGVKSAPLIKGTEITKDISRFGLVSIKFNITRHGENLPGHMGKTFHTHRLTAKEARELIAVWEKYLEETKTPEQRLLSLSALGVALANHQKRKHLLQLFSAKYISLDESDATEDRLNYYP